MATWIKRELVGEIELDELSDGSKAILKQLSSPLKATLYYSKTAANKGSEGIKTFNLYKGSKFESKIKHIKNILTLPMYPGMEMEDIKYIKHILCEMHKKHWEHR